MCCTVEFEGPNVIEATNTRTCRKPRRCDECRLPIRAGERYECFRALFDGSWTTTSTCPACVAMREAYRAVDDDPCWIPGELAESIVECSESLALMPPAAAGWALGIVWRLTSERQDAEARFIAERAARRAA